MKNLTCLRCGETLRFLGRERIQLGKTGWLLGDLPNLLSGALETEIYVCSKCRKLEFFYEENAAQSDTLPQKTCPACGAIHDFDYPRCPKCKHDYRND